MSLQRWKKLDSPGPSTEREAAIDSEYACKGVLLQVFNMAINDTSTCIVQSLHDVDVAIDGSVKKKVQWVF